MAILDIEGLERPILKEEKDNLENLSKKDEREDGKEVKRENEKEDIEKIFKEKVEEKIITELFLQYYIIYNSNIIIIVVGSLTYSEQNLLTRIKNELSKLKMNKPIFIIHNLMTYTTEEQVEDYIKEVLLKCMKFNLEEGDKNSSKLKTKSGKFFYEKNSNFPIYHLLFANEDSIAGNIYNELTLQFLEDNYHNVIDLKNFDIVKTIKDGFTELSKSILEKPETIKFDDSKEEIVKLDWSGDIKLKKILLELKEINSIHYEPPYNFYKMDDKIVVKIEVPGNCELISGLDFSGEYIYINISGEKKKDNEPRDPCNNIFNNRKIGKFFVIIPLKTKEYLLKNEKPSIMHKQGVFILEYRLENEHNKATFIYSEDDEI